MSAGAVDMARVVGNDVVDLGDPDARPEGRHPRFDALAFSEPERSWIGAGQDAERRRWSLWAAKEAAHKALRQEEPDLGFAPRRYRTILDGRGDGTVRCGDRAIRVRVRVEGDRVHALAFRGDPDAIVSGVSSLAPLRSDDPHAAARELLLASFPEGLAPRIERVDRIPRVRVGEDTLAASLSHHGRLVAFARVSEPRLEPTE